MLLCANRNTQTEEHGMKKVILLLPLATSMWAATITSGTYTDNSYCNTGCVSGSAVTWSLSGDSLSQISVEGEPVSSALTVIFESGSFGAFSFVFGNTTSGSYPSECGSCIVSAVVGGVTYTAGANTTFNLNLNFVGPTLPDNPVGDCFTLPGCTATVSGVPFTMTGSIVIVNNGITVLSDALTGAGTAQATHHIDPNVGSIDGTYTFSTTPEPSTSGMVAFGVGGILLLGVEAKRRRLAGGKGCYRAEESAFSDELESIRKDSRVSPFGIDVFTAPGDAGTPVPSES